MGAMVEAGFHSKRQKVIYIGGHPLIKKLSHIHMKQHYIFDKATHKFKGIY